MASDSKNDAQEYLDPQTRCENKFEVRHAGDFSFESSSVWWNDTVIADQQRIWSLMRAINK